MKGFDFRARYNAAKKGNGKTTITVKTLECNHGLWSLTHRAEAGRGTTIYFSS